MVELLTITVKTVFWFVDIGGIVDHRCLNFLLFNSSNINEPKESFSSDGQQFIQYQQTKRKFEE
jgi:hypothetical protein